MEEGSRTGTIITWILVIIFGGLFVSSLGANPSSTEAEIVEDICETITIPYEVKEVDNPDYDLDSHTVETEGENGERKICHNEQGDETVNEVILEPVTEVVYVGTAEPEPVHYPEYEVDEGGAICNDGSRSYSTGSGTCSWHGGVSYWL